MTANNLSTEASNQGEEGSKVCILVVDNDVKILRFLRSSLTLAGYFVITATSGNKALKLLESEKPNIMLLDMLMPAMDGFEVLRRLRAISKLPVIAISSDTSAGQRALHLGANDFLEKPFIPDKLVEKINVLLRR